MTPLPPAEILTAFAPHERRSLRPPPDSCWAEMDFLAWIHRSGHLAYLVCDIDGALSGLALERRVIATHGVRRFMCDLCCTLHGQGGVAAFTRWNRARTAARTAMLCADLACSRYVRGLRRNDCVQMAETLSTAEKIDRLMLNLRHLIRVMDLNRSPDV